MRNRMIVGVAVGLAVGLSLILGCASTRIKGVSAAEFLKHVQQADLLGSFAWTSYIGSTRLPLYFSRRGAEAQRRI